jgi:hypothetical protein
MKTLLERAQALLDSSRDWFLGKESQLHRDSAEFAVAAAEELEVLRERVRQLEEKR